MDVDGWRVFKTTFNRYRRRWERKTGHIMPIVAKQHITIKRGKVNGFKDDCHFDYIGYSDANLPIEEIRELILSWIEKSGGKRSRSSCKEIIDRSPENLQGLTDYSFKFPNSESIKTKFMKFAPLPFSKLPTTWVMGSFWQRKSEVITSDAYWNDELKTSTRKLSPMDGVWLDWIKSVCGDGIPRFTTEHYRAKLKAQSLADAELLWEEFTKADCGTAVKSNNHPIINIIRNSDIPTLDNCKDKIKNTVNNVPEYHPSMDPLMNTMKSIDGRFDKRSPDEQRQFEFCFDGYSLQPIDFDRYKLRIGVAGSWRDPDAIVSDGYSLIDGNLNLDQAKHVVSKLGYTFHDRTKWQESGMLRAPTMRMALKRSKQSNLKAPGFDSKSR